jgi:CO/xanthine dehydrogenase FAD-binding subunit
LANNDPAADYPAAVLGWCDGAHNKRKIAADDFFKGMYETALAADESHHRGQLSDPEEGGYMKFPQPASRFALVGVLVAHRVRVCASLSPAPRRTYIARMRSRRRWQRVSAPTQQRR